jgi:hypothetical protein
MKTHCPKSHEYTKENTYVDNRGGRSCKQCRKDNFKNFKQKNPNKVYESTKIANHKWKEKNPDYWIRHQKKRHGISEEKHAALMEKQNNCCAICKRPFVAGDTPHIDHNHECCPGAYSCGECVRGLLCANCNFGLGSFKDNETNLRNALEYLADSPASEK